MIVLPGFLCSDVTDENNVTGVVLDEAQTILGQGMEIKNSKPRKEDIVQE